MTTFKGLPPALETYAAQSRWLIWRKETTKKGKPTKVPYCAFAPLRKARCNDPKTWSTFDIALKAYQDSNGKVAGVGLCLLGSDLGAFDLDDCRNVVTGELEPFAQDLITRAQSYTETTPSGNGFRILLKSNGFRIQRKQSVPNANGMSLETYRDCERYITVTGDALPGTPDEIVDDKGLIDETVAKLDAQLGEHEEMAKEAKKEARKEAKGATARRQKKRRNLDDVIKNGEQGFFDGDRSRAVWWVVNKMIRRGDDDNAITAVLLDRGRLRGETGNVVLPVFSDGPPAWLCDRTRRQVVRARGDHPSVRHSISSSMAVSPSLISMTACLME